MVNFLIIWAVATVILYVLARLFDGFARYMASGPGTPFPHLKAAAWCAGTGLVLALNIKGIMALV